MELLTEAVAPIPGAFPQEHPSFIPGWVFCDRGPAHSSPPGLCRQGQGHSLQGRGAPHTHAVPGGATDRSSSSERLILMLHVKQLQQLVHSEAFKPTPPAPAPAQKMDF